jgi:hypothetical protein
MWLLTQGPTDHYVDFVVFIINLEILRLYIAVEVSYALARRSRLGTLRRSRGRGKGRLGLCANL